MHPSRSSACGSSSERTFLPIASGLSSHLNIRQTSASCFEAVERLLSVIVVYVHKNANLL